MEYYQALQTAALLAVLKPDGRAWLRHVQRSYSKWFCTPLHIVAQLPLEEVIQAYYEHSYEEMSDEDRDYQLSLLAESDEERAQREALEKKVEESEDKLMDDLTRQVEEDMKSGKITKEQIQKLQKKSSKPKKVEPEPSQPEEPLINMDFSGDNLLDESLLESDPLGPNRKR